MKPWNETKPKHPLEKEGKMLESWFWSIGHGLEKGFTLNLWQGNTLGALAESVWAKFWDVPIINHLLQHGIGYRVYNTGFSLLNNPKLIIQLPLDEETVREWYGDSWDNTWGWTEDDEKDET